MTDTTDIKALIDDVCLAAAGIHNLGRSVSDERVQGVIDFIRSKLESAFEAERQRVKELTETAGRWPDPLEHPAIKALQSGDIFNPEVLSVFDKLAREIQAHRNYRRFDYMEELPKKPVALPKSHYVCGCADRYMSGKEVKAAIESSGDIVKEGE